jgi:hypothetical protein
MTEWKRIFAEWPEDLNRKGILLTTFGEQIPFDGFLIGDDMLFIERPTPDALGGRAVMLGYETISGVKFVDAIKAKPFHTLGFQGSLKSR